MGYHGPLVVATPNSLGLSVYQQVHLIGQFGKGCMGKHAHVKIGAWGRSKLVLDKSLG